MTTQMTEPNRVSVKVESGADAASASADQAKLNYYQLFWIFFIGCVVGVVVETLWCLMMRHRYESRVGLLIGPFNPVYGFGAVLLTVCLKWLQKKHTVWTFIGGMVIGGAFEYICSLFQELAFGTVSWEYSHSDFNIGGRTNLKYAFFWGLLAVLWMRLLYPRVVALIVAIPRKPGMALTVILSVFMVFNMIYTVLAVGRQSQRRDAIPAQTAIGRFMDEHYDDETLGEIFPNMSTRSEID